MKQILKKLYSQNVIIKITEILFTIFLLFFPFKIDFLIANSNINITGKENIYQMHFISFSQILILLILIGITLTSAINSKTKNIKKENLRKRSSIYQNFKLIIFIGGITLLILNIVNSININNTAFNFIYIIEGISIYLIIKSKLISRNRIINLILISSSIISIIAITQFFIQHSIGHGLQYFGEPQIAPDILGVAKIDLQNTKAIRPYGTFQHPNILAAYLGVCLVLISEKFIKSKNISKIQKSPHTKIKKMLNKIKLQSIFILILMGFILTFSRSTYLAITIVFLLQFLQYSKKKFIKNKNKKHTNKIKCKRNYKKYIAAFVIIIITALTTTQIKIIKKTIQARATQNNQENFSLRKIYIQNSFTIISQNFLTGIGLGNYTEEQPKISYTKLAPWDNQPVHNTELLLLSELGVPLGSFICILFLLTLIKNLKKDNHYFSKKAKSNIYLLIFILIISQFDHYFITNAQGRELLAIVFGLYFYHNHSKTIYNQLHSSQVTAK